MRVWRLPADVSSDDLAPAHATRRGIDAAARVCLQTLRPGFANQVRRGDVIVAGANFGIGPAREQAAAVLLRLGVAAVVAPGYAGTYFRAAFNVGLLLLTCPRALVIADGEAIAFDARAGCIARGSGELLETEAIPGFLLDRVEAGGLLGELRVRVARRAGANGVTGMCAVAGVAGVTGIAGGTGLTDAIGATGGIGAIGATHADAAAPLLGLDAWRRLLPD